MTNKVSDYSPVITLDEAALLYIMIDTDADTILESRTVTIASLRTWLSRPRGALYFSTPASTTIVAATPIKAAGTTAEMGSNKDVTVATTNRLTNASGLTLDFRVLVTLSLLKGAGGVTDAIVYVYKNGAAVAGLEIPRHLADVKGRPISLSGVVSLADTDYLEIWLETDTGDDLTVSGQFSIEAVK